MSNTQFCLFDFRRNLKNNLQKIFKTQTYINAICKKHNLDWQISPTALKEQLSNTKTSRNLEIIAVLNNLKLPFEVNQTIHINKFDAEKINIDHSKTYIMVCQRGLNSYRATERLKKKYPKLKVLNLTGGISSYK